MSASRWLNIACNPGMSSCPSREAATTCDAVSCNKESMEVEAGEARVGGQGGRPRQQAKPSPHHSRPMNLVASIKRCQPPHHLVQRLVRRRLTQPGVLQHLCRRWPQCRVTLQGGWAGQGQGCSGQQLSQRPASVVDKACPITFTRPAPAQNPRTTYAQHAHATTGALLPTWSMRRTRSLAWREI